MKKNFIRFSFLAIMGLATLSCSKSEPAPAVDETTTNEPQVKEDEEVLSNDSATVETTIGVKDEEANAKQQEQAEDQKLKTDEKQEVK